MVRKAHQVVHLIRIGCIVVEQPRAFEASDIGVPRGADAPEFLALFIKSTALSSSFISRSISRERSSPSTESGILIRARDSRVGRISGVCTGVFTLGSPPYPVAEARHWSASTQTIFGLSDGPFTAHPLRGSIVSDHTYETTSRFSAKIISSSS